MKKTLLILVLAYCLLPIAYGQDVQRFAERGVMGTARYIGMGGAMTAIGGDPSAAMDNPAGLGLYRRSEVLITLDETIDRTQQQDSRDVYQCSRFALPQVSAIWASGYPQKQKGLIYNNLLISLNRLYNYRRVVNVKGDAMGMLPSICDKTNTNRLTQADILQEDIWNIEDIGWLSVLGYDAGLLVPDGQDQWTPSTSFSQGELTVSEKGSQEQLTLSWAGNINNQWYIGASVNIPTISYSKEVALYEYNSANHSAELISQFYANGWGISASVGMIARPTQWLRIGASLQTPTVLTLDIQTCGDIYSQLALNQRYEQTTPLCEQNGNHFASPLRSSIGIAGQWKNIGLLSLQYDYAHALRDKETNSSPMLDIHTLKAGLEAQVYRHMYLNAGYVYESSFTKDDPIVVLPNNSVRTDMDYRYPQSTQYASAGLSYRNDRLIISLAYQYGWQSIHQYATDYQIAPALIHTKTHRIACSIAWRIDRETRPAEE